VRFEVRNGQAPTPAADGTLLRDFSGRKRKGLNRRKDFSRISIRGIAGAGETQEIESVACTQWRIQAKGSEAISQSAAERLVGQNEYPHGD
jgi:hypothetical protein